MEYTTVFEMVDDPEAINTKIMTIRETLSKLSRSMKTSEALTDPVPPLPPKEPRIERGSSVIRQELGEGSSGSGGNSYQSDHDQPRFTLDDYIQPRIESPIRSYRDTQSPIREETPYMKRDTIEAIQRRDLLEELRDKITQKERELRFERDNFAKLQIQLDTIKSAFRDAKLTFERDMETHKLELDREKRYRMQLESDLEAVNLQLKQDKSLKFDLQNLHNRLEETNKLKIELLTENADLHKIVQNKELEVMKLKEEMRVSTGKIKENFGKDEEQSTELKNSQREIVRLKRENEENKAKEARLEKEILSLKNEISVLKSTESTKNREKTDENVSELKSKIIELEEKLLKSASENENLYIELSSRPTHKQIKEKDRAIDDLKSELLETLQNRRKDAHSVSPRRHLATYREKNEPELTIFVAEIMAALHVSSRSEALNKINRLRKAKSQGRKLVNRLGTLVVECSPKEAFREKPSEKDIWKWTRRLAEEYMSLRQSHEAHQLNSDLISDLLELLNLVYPSEIPTVLEQLLQENHRLKDLIDRVKQRFSLDSRASFDEISESLTSPKS